MFGQVILDLLPDDWDLGEEVDTTLNGPYVDISEGDEAGLLPLFTEAGVAFRRDDAVVASLSDFR
jgi:hypothetical protein